MNTYLGAKENLEEEIVGKMNFVNEMQEQKAAQRKEIENAGDFLLEQEEKVNEANVTAMELLGQLKEADAEIEHLRAQVGELQGKVKNL